MGNQKQKIVQYDENSRHYVINGEPIGWAKIVPARNETILYDKHQPFKTIIRDTLKEQHGIRAPFNGPLEMNLLFIMTIPPIATRKHASYVDGYHAYKPSIESMEKWIVELGIGLLYKEECQISLVTKKKIYGLEPRTEIIIRELI